MAAEISERLRASTHTVFIDRVVDAGHTDVPPMVYSGGRLFDGERLTELEG